MIRNKKNYWNNLRKKQLICYIILVKIFYFLMKLKMKKKKEKYILSEILAPITLKNDNLILYIILIN